MANERVGAVIVFEEGVTAKEAEKLIAEYAWKMKLAGPFHTAHSYDPSYGSPVWYIP